MHDGVGDVKQPVVPRDGGGVYAFGIGDAGEVELAFAGQHIAYLFPVLQVGGVVDGNARKPLESGGHDVVVALYPDDAGVGVETGDDGVLYGLRTPGEYCHP